MAIGETILTYSTITQQHEIIELLLRKGVSVDVEKRVSHEVLIILVLRFTTAACCLCFIESNYPTDRCNLHQATHCEHLP